MTPVQVASLSLKLCGIYVWTQIAYLLALAWHLGGHSPEFGKGLELVPLAVFVALGALLFLGAEPMARWMVRGASAEPTTHGTAEAKQAVVYSVVGLAMVLSSLANLAQIVFVHSPRPLLEGSSGAWGKVIALLAVGMMLLAGLVLFLRSGRSLALLRRLQGTEDTREPEGYPNQVLAFSVVGLFFLVMGLSAIALTFSFHSTWSSDGGSSASWRWNLAPLWPGGLRAILGGVVFYRSRALAGLWRRLQGGVSIQREA